MTNKFTEEQYEEVINLWNSYPDYDDALRLLIDYIDGLHSLNYTQAIAIANPLTREWAYDKFVDKE